MTQPRSDAPALTLPPPPWHLTGNAWLGSLTTKERWQAPDGLRTPGKGRSLVVAAFRFDGFPSYDELSLSSPVRVGPKIGLLTRVCWVTSPQVAAAKQTRWHMNAHLGQFSWSEDGVTVKTEHSSISLALAPAHSGPVRFAPRLAASGITVVDGTPAVFPSTMKARFRRGRLAVTEWSGDQLPELVRDRGRFAITGQVSEIVLTEPRIA